jgi:5,10-methylene-tetrahydrofolate dehydrogenase/methenyl tetrahydrofolate cyclohydrolase
MRYSSLSSDAIAIDREINSNFEAVNVVSENIEVVKALSEADLVSLLSSLNEAKDFTGITVVSGATAEWDRWS